MWAWTADSRSCSIDRMRKKGSSDSIARKVANSSPATVEEYLAAVAEPARGMLVTMRAAIRSVLPGEAIEIISYRMPAFKHKKVLVWFAAFKGHCSLFPTAAVIEQFRDALKGYTIAKGTVQFPLDKPLPVALIRKLVKARLEQSEGIGKKIAGAH
jgi:uncharacterized protein YdhG (YjbR/CyaY superfamily)